MRSGEILGVMLWQHKLKKREIEGYCADAYEVDLHKDALRTENPP